MPDGGEISILPCLCALVKASASEFWMSYRFEELGIFLIFPGNCSLSRKKQIASATGFPYCPTVTVCITQLQCVVMIIILTKMIITIIIIHFIKLSFIERLNKKQSCTRPRNNLLKIA